MKQILDSDFNAFRNFIENHSFFFIAGHKEPDGDCMASCLGAAAILEHFGKKYQLLSAGPFKRNEVRRFENRFSSEMEFLSDAERKSAGFIIVDCSEISRLGEIDGEFSDLDFFVIDHHKTSGLPEGYEGYIDSESPACAYLVQRFYENLCGKIPEVLSKDLFFGLCTDTGFFKFVSQKNAEIFEGAARLVEAGADPRHTYKMMNSGKPYSTRKLLGLLLSKAERYLEGKLVITCETLEDTKRFGLDGRDSDALYSLFLATEGVKAVVFLRQDTETTCTGGFRSEDEIDVSKVAAKFGGGGHKNASGMSCNGRIETLLPQIVKEFARIM